MSMEDSNNLFDADFDLLNEEGDNENDDEEEEEDAPMVDAPLPDEDNDNDNDNDEDMDEDDDEDDDEDEDEEDEEGEGEGDVDVDVEAEAGVQHDVDVDVGTNADADRNVNSHDNSHNRHKDDDEQETSLNKQTSEATSTKEKKDTTTTPKKPSYPDPTVIIDSNPTTATTLRQRLVERAKSSIVVEVSPLVAIPYTSPVHSIALTKGPKWLFTGGEDGLIRKFDFFGSVEGRAPLTVAQRHQLVDSISYGGMITSYWENEQPYYKNDLMEELAKPPPNSKNKNKKIDVSTITTYEPQVSPVYSLVAESNGFWLLSGLKSGGISLQSVRSSEGSIQYYFKEGKEENRHNSTVSALKLNSDETKFISGSWDMKLLQWDLNTGENITSFTKSTGQISSIDFRPVGVNNLSLADFKNNQQEDDENKKDDDMDSLFGGDDEDDEDSSSDKVKEVESTGSNEETIKKNIKQYQNETANAGFYEGCVRSDQVFLSSSINGTVNIWDARLSQTNNEVNSIGVNGTAPWCTSAIWSNDGNQIYVGRRNAIVDAYDIRNLKTHSNQYKFPIASGPISCIRTLPNKDYLLCGCQDNVRLYDLKLATEEAQEEAEAEAGIGASNKKRKKKIPFMIIPGHSGGILSDLYVDPTCRFMISSSGNRGWQGKAADYVFIYKVLAS